VFRNAAKVDAVWAGAKARAKRALRLYTRIPILLQLNRNALSGFLLLQPAAVYPLAVFFGLPNASDRPFALSTTTVFAVLAPSGFCKE